MTATHRTSAATFWAAVGTAFLLPMLAGLFLLTIATAPAGQAGRMVVVFADSPDTTEAVSRIAASGARPVRAMNLLDSWIIDAEAPGAVPLLHAMGASRVFRDLGFDKVLAGCMAFGTGEPRPPVVVAPR